jgi:hypothetical protein
VIFHFCITASSNKPANGLTSIWTFGLTDRSNGLRHTNMKTHRTCGSSLASDAYTAVRQTHRSDPIAGKPAPPQGMWISLVVAWLVDRLQHVLR